MCEVGLVKVGWGEWRRGRGMREGEREVVGWVIEGVESRAG